MSAIIGGANFICNLPYDAIYHKDNEFGERIARNQLLILKHESYFDKVNNPADGAYYIESITNQLAEKALATVQHFDPPGVGARNLKECLLLQLTPGLLFYEELLILIENHLEDLENNRLPLIVKKTGFSL